MKITKLILPFCSGFLAGLCCASARAQAVPIRSFSEQFTSWQLRQPAFRNHPAKPTLTPVAGSWAYLLSSSTAPALSNTEEVTLDPAFLVAQCERLKGVLLGELRQADNWRGRIDLILDPSLSEETGPQLTAINRPQGWTYKLVLPKTVRQEILLRSLFQTLFLEMANRHAGVQSADIPLWLVEGMCAHVQADNLGIFMLQPGQYVSTNVVWGDKKAQMMSAEFRQHGPLDFQQLSWPTSSDLTVEGLPVYRSCAQLFLEQLLRFADGRACLGAMIAQLPEHWNWQTAFLRAFHAHFEQLLDVEKWWSVSYVDFSRGTQAQAWSAENSRLALQNCLDVPVEVHFDPNHMPVAAKITLQEVIRQWPPGDALEALQHAIGALKFLEPRATQDWRSLAQLYLRTLLQYLEASQSAKGEPMLGKHSLSLSSVTKADTIQQLDVLDRQRETLSKSAASTYLPQLSASEAASAKSAIGR